MVRPSCWKWGGCAFVWQTGQCPERVWEKFGVEEAHSISGGVVLFLIAF